MYIVIKENIFLFKKLNILLFRFDCYCNRNDILLFFG